MNIIFYWDAIKMKR